MKHFDIVELVRPCFAGKPGDRAVLIERYRPKLRSYLSVTLQNGVSFPADPADFKVVGSISEV